MRNTAGWLPQFSIRTLLLLVALACVALATTVSASEPVLNGIRLLSAISIPVAILLAILIGLRRKRACDRMWATHRPLPP